MRAPTLQSATIISAAVHLAFFLAAVLILRYSRSPVLPSPYVVSLVGPGSAARAEAPKESAPEAKEEAAPPPAKETVAVREPEKKIKDAKADDDWLSKQMAKLKERKKLRDIVDMRKNREGEKNSAGRSTAKSGAQSTAAGAAKGTALDNYYGQITDQIRTGWSWPPAGDRNLETVIAVKIAKDGTITVQGIEKSSGDRLFDRSVMRAIANASPVLPPPGEIEIGLRFYP